jgi:hypothetical protein
MGLFVILLVVGALALGCWLLYRRPKTIRTDGLPGASIHTKDDVRDIRSAADQFRDGTGGGGTGWA